jgi:hypothetical protein
MPESPGLNSQDAEVPDFLRGLQPSLPAPAVARGIWYQSGYQAGRAQVTIWRGATLTLLVGMSALLGWQRVAHRTTDLNQTIIAKAPTAPRIQPPTEAPSSGFGSYARLLNSLMQDGSRPWAEESVPAGNPHTPPAPGRSGDGMELTLPPFN